jgi:hypothetical protein
VKDTRLFACALVLAACGESSPADDDLSEDVASDDDIVTPGDDDDNNGPIDAAPQTIFVAQGHMGRTIVSCDGGRTWTNNQSNDDAVRCFTDGVDCDHGPEAGRGIGYADGRFYATFGWGQPGGVRVSDDGVTWTTALPDVSFGGVGAAGAIAIAGGHSPQVSLDRGATWAPTADPVFPIWNVRRTASVLADTAQPAFVLIGNDGDVFDAAITRDNGATWTHPELPDGCATGDLQSGGGIVSGAGVVVIASAKENAVACRSTDGGATFTAHPIGGTISSQLVWTGTEFVAWGDGHVVKSPDGETWTRTPTTPAGISLGVMGAADGVLVAVRGGWQVWYEQEKFYRSTDGVAWEELPATAFTGSHPIRHMAVGSVAQSPACN